MQDYTITGEQLQAFRQRLVWEEKSPATIEKYLRDAADFTAWLDGRAASKAAAGAWKAALLEAKLAPATINVKLAAVNRFLVFLGWPAFRVKPLRIQRRLFRDDSRELTRPEYLRLLETARAQGRERLALLLETICGTGIRVSEVRHITVEAVGIGQANVDCKGKNRVVFLPKVLCRALQRYCRKHGIDSGPVFKTAGGKPLDRTNIWRDMKALCNRAGVEPGKVFPHNLRHLFARTYYKLEKDLSRLADLLGHSSVTTTRIYTMESGKSHIRQLERIGLVLAKK